MPGKEAVDLAQNDLAEQLNITTQAIEVAIVQPVEWRDSSLGCPQRGVMYAQVITPGFWIVLKADKQYIYHTDAGKKVVLCQEVDLGALPRLPVDVDKIKDGQPWMPVD